MRYCLQCSAQISEESWTCPNCRWSPDIQDGIVILSPDIINDFNDYPEEEHDCIAQLQTTNFWFLRRNQIIVHVLNRFFPQSHNLLEIGCGTGFVLYGISQARSDMALFGAEASPTALKYAKERVKNADFAQMNVYRLPFIEEFDVVGAFDVLEHMSDDIAALKEIYRTTKNGGGIVLTVPQHPWLWSSTDDMAGHKRRYTQKELKEKVQAAGFEVLYMTSFITLLLPLMLISRLKKDRQKETDQVKCELNLPKPLNAMFNSICALELSVIKSGGGLPIGGSLLCAAIKKAS